MPWQPKDAVAKTKAVATSPTAQRQWAHVADSVLDKTGDEGLAIREASGVVKKEAQSPKNPFAAKMPRKPTSKLASIKA